MGSLLKKNKVEHVEGFATFLNPHEIEVEKDGEKRSIRAKNFIIASGSAVIMPPIPGMEGGREEGIWTSDDAVTTPHIPGKVLIIGGGVIGVEFGYVFHGLGSEVTIVEMMPQLLPMMDEELGKELAKSFTRQGIKLMPGNAVEKMAKSGSGWKVTVSGGGKTEEIEVDVVLVAVGRRSYTDNLGIEKVGVKANRRGIEVDDMLRTSLSHIYAIGDVTGRIQLAHVASYEGQIAAENAVKGTNKSPDYRAVPNCIYTVPEVASVGMSEGEARESGKEVVVGKFHFRGLGKAMAAGTPDGFVKVVAGKEYGEILGVHMVGSHVTDLIGQATLAIKLEATIDVLVDTIHAHPTLTEALLEAYEDTHGMAIHK